MVTIKYTVKKKNNFIQDRIYRSSNLSSAISFIKNWSVTNESNEELIGKMVIVEDERKTA